MAALALAGCGDLDGSEPDPTPARVSAAQLERYPRGTPERAFLDWHRAIADVSLEQAAALYDPALGISADELRRQRYTAANLFNYLGPPQIIDVVRSGRRVTVYAYLRNVEVAPNGRRDVTRNPRSFNLGLIDDSWKLVDNHVLRVAAQGAVDALNRPEGK